MAAHEEVHKRLAAALQSAERVRGKLGETEAALIEEKTKGSAAAKKLISDLELRIKVRPACSQITLIPARIPISTPSQSTIPPSGSRA